MHTHNTHTHARTRTHARTHKHTHASVHPHTRPHSSQILLLLFSFCVAEAGTRTVVVRVPAERHNTKPNRLTCCLLQLLAWLHRYESIHMAAHVVCNYTHWALSRRSMKRITHTHTHVQHAHKLEQCAKSKHIKRLKRTLFSRTNHSMSIFGVIPFIKLQNDT